MTKHCPHCDGSLDGDLRFHLRMNSFAQEFIMLCPHCDENIRVEYGDEGFRVHKQ